MPKMTITMVVDTDNFTPEGLKVNADLVGEVTPKVPPTSPEVAPEATSEMPVDAPEVNPAV